MELPGALQSMGEGAITLAGLAAVFRAFQGGRDPQGHSRTRLDAVIEGGFVVAYLCFFPAWLLSTSVSQEFIWRATGLPAAVWVAARSLVPGLIILRKDGTSPRSFVLAWPWSSRSFSPSGWVRSLCCLCRPTAPTCLLRHCCCSMSVASSSPSSAQKQMTKHQPYNKAQRRALGRAAAFADLPNWLQSRKPRSESPAQVASQAA